MTTKLHGGGCTCTGVGIHCLVYWWHTIAVTVSVAWGHYVLYCCCFHLRRHDFLETTFTWPETDTLKSFEFWTNCVGFNQPCALPLPACLWLSWTVTTKDYIQNLMIDLEYLAIHPSHYSFSPANIHTWEYTKENIHTWESPRKIGTQNSSNLEISSKPTNSAKRCFKLI